MSVTVLECDVSQIYESPALIFETLLEKFVQLYASKSPSNAFKEVVAYRSANFVLLSSCCMGDYGALEGRATAFDVIVFSIGVPKVLALLDVKVLFIRGILISCEVQKFDAGFDRLLPTQAQCMDRVGP